MLKISLLILLLSLSLYAGDTPEGSLIISTNDDRELVSSNVVFDYKGDATVRLTNNKGALIGTIYLKNGLIKEIKTKEPAVKAEVVKTNTENKNNSLEAITENQIALMDKMYELELKRVTIEEEANELIFKENIKKLRAFFNSSKFITSSITPVSDTEIFRISQNNIEEANNIKSKIQDNYRIFPVYNESQSIRKVESWQQIYDTPILKTICSGWPVLVLNGNEEQQATAVHIAVNQYRDSNNKKIEDDTLQAKANERTRAMIADRMRKARMEKEEREAYIRRQMQNRTPITFDEYTNIRGR